MVATRARGNDGRRKSNNREEQMAVSRRDVLLGSAGAVGAATLRSHGPYGPYTTIGLRWNFGGW